jgi:predicted ester cyclase
MGSETTGGSEEGGEMAGGDSSAAAADSSAAAIARAYFDRVGARDVDGMMEFWEPGGVGDIHGVAVLTAPTTYREWFGELFAAFPDFRFEVLDLVAEGDQAAVRWRATGTFDGDRRFEGLIPNGASVDITGFDLLTIRGGKIQRNEAYMNGVEMGQQLGIMPPKGSGAERALTAAANLKTKLGQRLRRVSEKHPWSPPGP